MSKKHQPDYQRTLVLNASGEAINIAPIRRAMNLIEMGKADLVLSSGRYLHSTYRDIEIPSVVRLREYKNIPRDRSITLTPRTVLARDKRKCAYQIPKLCEGTATTIDHIFPRGKGGEHSWENVVAACRKCNHKKGDKLLEDLGWSLKFKPFRPQGPGARLLLHATDPAWEPFLKF